MVGDDPATVGSGPTAPDPGLLAARRAARRHGVALPPGAGAGPTAGDPTFRRVRHVLLASHAALVRAAARCLRAPARPGARGAVETLARRYGRALRARRRFAAGGEPVIALGRRPGRGGRAQHLALLVAREIAGVRGVAFLAAGSDGIDGNTRAAGAVVTGATWPEALRRGLRPAAALARRDSHRVHRALGTLVVTGPTGSNLLDLHLGLVARPR